MPRTSDATKRANVRAIEASAKAYEAMRQAYRLAEQAAEAFGRDGIRDCAEAWKADSYEWLALIARATDASL